MRRICYYLAFLNLFTIQVFSNNLQIGAPVFIDKNTNTGQVNIRFDISWDNSWRTDNLNNDGVTNWDAVWLFVKYKTASDGLWHHAVLNTTTTNHSTGSQGTAATLSPRADGIGAFYHRSGNGTGTFSSTNVRLCWNYVSNGVGNNLSEEIIGLKVFGIEMVYIPQGAFYVGSGGNEENHFYTYGTNNQPYLINSENQISVGTANGILYYDDYGFGGDRIGPIPTAFPKGFNAFYCMKYEITQEQYAEFLNTLTTLQQSSRFSSSFNYNRYFIKSINGIYGNDANNNNVLNEADDGQNIACNSLSWEDGAAYSDWSGLRPMTELEYEKVCRGTETSVANEYAWGTTTIGQANSYISNPNSSSEWVYGNCNYWYWGNSYSGPLRVGNYSYNSVNRIYSGSGFYGVMELSGNLWERCITVGNNEGRSFTGLPGNGILDLNGKSDVLFWPNDAAIGSGYRGGGWDSDYNQNRTFLQVSDRSRSTFTYLNDWTSRWHNYGFRCVSGL